MRVSHQNVIDARRANNPRQEMAIIAETMKSIENSGYGSLIKEENTVCLLNRPQFRKVEFLEPQEAI